MYNDRKQKKTNIWWILHVYTTWGSDLYKSETTKLQNNTVTENIKREMGTTQHTLLPCGNNLQYRINETVKVTRYMYTNTIKRIYIPYIPVFCCFFFASNDRNDLDIVLNYGSMYTTAVIYLKSCTLAVLVVNTSKY